MPGVEGRDLDDIEAYVARSGAVGGQMDANAGMLLYEFDRERSQYGAGVFANRLDAQCAEGARFEIAPLGDVVVQFHQSLQTVLEQAFAGFSEDKAVRRAMNERETE